ncbi:hypothetical protein [Treponema sp. R80B11-R83G3]
MKKLLLILTVLTFYFTGCDLTQTAEEKHDDDPLSGQYSAYYGYDGPVTIGPDENLYDPFYYKYKKPVNTVRELVYTKNTQSTIDWSDKKINALTKALNDAEVEDKILIVTWKDGYVLIVKTAEPTEE